ncbi:hypothetical protein EZ428_17790 [Pedobacter frigiditerrae]|uniref:Uncharacterized protein n=1 Tax=Pedobacter frigiditerrae TaxID=2530452 RepID=A0A4R0MNX6_9SPHI|nr:hypothetical protein [Pedobacter frigiditerrae]TCC88495.1 hypothetical protein EZ428_17790 [Pedobacter frigiditerrae]
MTDEELQVFIDNYSTVDFDRIKLIWNGKYGQDFIDDNYDFRIQVCEFVVPQIEKVKLGLIRDLYCETGKTSPMTFGVYLKFHLFADELLKRGGTDYLLDYIRGASHSMDTGMRSGILTISTQTAKELLAYFDQLKSKSTDPEELSLLNDFIRHRLEYNANKEESPVAQSTLPKARQTWLKKLFGFE